MTDSTCQQCGATLPERRPGQRGRARTYCSKSCTSKASRLRDPSVHKRHQAKYRKSAKGKASRHRDKVERVCIACDTTWLTERRDAKYCSLLCRDYYRWGPRFSPWSPKSRALVLYVAQPAVPETPTAKPVWVSGPCSWCSEQFTTCTWTAAAYCSDYCGRRAKRARRRARENDASGTYTWGEVTKLWISIGKACAYCHEGKRNDEIEPDHVVPLSRGGSNSITNVVPACHPCNGDKRDLTLDEWIPDRIRRGLTPRYIHPAFTRLAPLLRAA